MTTNSQNIIFTEGEAEIQITFLFAKVAPSVSSRNEMKSRLAGIWNILTGHHRGYCHKTPSESL